MSSFSNDVARLKELNRLYRVQDDFKIFSERHELILKLHRVMSQASEFGNTKTVKLLLDLGVEPDTRSFMNAIINNHPEVVKLILDFSSHYARIHEEMPIQNASERGHFKIVQLLLQHGASPKAIDLKFYSTPAAILLGLKYKAPIPEYKMLDFNRYLNELNQYLVKDLSRNILEYI